MYFADPCYKAVQSTRLNSSKCPALDLPMFSRMPASKLRSTRAVSAPIYKITCNSRQFTARNSLALLLTCTGSSFPNWPSGIAIRLVRLCRAVLFQFLGFTRRTSQTHIRLFSIISFPDLTRITADHLASVATASPITCALCSSLVRVSILSGPKNRIGSNLMRGRQSLHSFFENFKV